MTQSTLLVAVLLAFALPEASVAFENGDSCGVTSTNFLNYDYRSDYMVAGEKGCSLGENNDTGCFCAPNLQDGQSLSEWQWQCNGVVNFGPSSPSKTCPDVVPVPKGLGLLDSVVADRNRRVLADKVVASVGSESLQQKMGVACDTAIHPTGRPGDEVCPYSNCDEGGDHSAICACIDLGKYGMGDGMEWVCMHATCSCGAAAEQDNETESTLATEDAEAEASSSSSAAMVVSALVSVSVSATALVLA